MRFARRGFTAALVATIAMRPWRAWSQSRRRRPDLIVTALGWSPAEPRVGDAVTFSATVKNQGTAPTPAGVIVGVAFRVGGTLATWSDTHTASIPAGGSVKLTANGGPSGASTWTAVAGLHTVRAHVDDVDRIAELDETNNTFIATLTVADPDARPDLVVSALRWSQDDGTNWHTGPIPAGSNVLFEAAVRNQGTAPTPAGVITGVAFLIDGAVVSWSDSRTAAIPAGATVSLRANGGPDGDRYWNNVQAGAYTLRAHVDDVNRIPNELDETNNTLDVQVTVQGVGSGPQAAPADRFVDSIGVNFHLSRSSEAANFTSGINFKQRLAELGIRHIREGSETANVGYRNRLIELYNDLGIKVTLITGTGTSNNPTAARNWVRDQLGPEKVAGVEGLNEPDIFIGGSNWAQTARNRQSELWNAWRMNGTAAIQAIPIYAACVTSHENADTVGDLGQWCDGGNIHPYPGGRNPETTGWGPRFGDYNYGDLRYGMQRIGEVNGGVGRRQIATETEYHTLHAYSGGHKGVPENVQAIYVPRLYLHYFTTTLPSGTNIERTFAYQLWDQGASSSDPERNFGWIRGDGTLKPAFTAMRNLIALLRDPGPAFTPGRLDYGLTGSTANLRHVLFQMRDGTFFLALWLDRPIWNVDTRQPIAVSPQAVTVTINQPVSAVARVFPNDGTSWTSLPVANGQVALSVTERVMLVRVTP